MVCSSGVGTTTKIVHGRFEPKDDNERSIFSRASLKSDAIL